MSDGPDVSHDLKESALFFHRHPRPGKLEIQATKPLGNQRDLALAYSPGVAAPCEAIARRSRPRPPTTTARANLVAVDLQRHRRARPRRYRPARLQAGDGRQGGPVQEIRRHRRVRHRDRRRRTSTSIVDVVVGARADLRRHQPRGHQGAGMLRGRGAAARRAWTSRSSTTTSTARRSSSAPRSSTGWSSPARRIERRQDRHLGRRRGGARLPQPPGLARRQAREHLGHRHRGRRLRGPRRR